MKKYLAFTIFSLAALSLRSQSYVASAIPDSLKENADVVTRLDETVVEIKSPGHVITRERHIYTILNGNADNYSTYNTFYDQFISIQSVNAVLYDANGKELKHFRKKDMQDLPQFEEGTLASDDRYKTGSFYYHTYPYTVSFEEEDEIEGILGLRGWAPPRTGNASLECSKYSIIAPKDYKVRYKLLNANISPVITEKNDKLTYAWEVRNLPAIPDEPYAVSWRSYNPYMLVGPSDFEAEGYKGDMSNWNNYGKFYYALQRGRDILPDELKQKVHTLTDNLSDDHKKVVALYDYLQKNTHYINIQFGIGGLQPFDATYVAGNKYGDCKALSNFMVSLLKEAGIKANSVIIMAGKDNTEFIKDFACHQFNHVICCVPLAKDTIWLECTSQYLPAGYLSSFTANRYGLLIDDKGGSLVHTPAYLMADNTQVRHIRAVLDTEGSLRVQSETRYRAECQDQIEEFVHLNSKEDQLKKLKNQFDLPTYDVSSFDYRFDYSNQLPVALETLQLVVSDYAQVSGKRIFINPDILTRSSSKLIADKERKLDVELRDEFSQTDSVEIAIPPGYETESKPRDVQLQGKFGRYSVHTVVRPDKIIYYREFEQFSGRSPAKEYDEVVKFYNQIYSSDHSRIVLVRKG